MDNTKNTIGLIVLGVLLLTFSVGGYFFMKYMTREVESDTKVVEEKKDYRIDKTKDYIYFEESQEVLESEEIFRDKVVINFTTLKDLDASLEKENDDLYKNIKYTKDMDLPKEDKDGNEIKYNENDKGIYSLNYREYQDIKYVDYVSLIVKDFSYDIVSGVNSIALKTYVINIKTGKLMTTKELLEKFNVSEDTIKTKVKERLTNTQTLVEDEMKVDIDGTLNDLSMDNLYINKVGKLAITFIVKSDQNHYNDNVELN